MFGAISFLWRVVLGMAVGFIFKRPGCVYLEDELYVLLMFARGSKSDKLAELFNIFDVNKTGYLSSGSFQRFVKSVLMCIVQWTEEY